MTRTIRALLVGIDNYPRPIPKLQGCLNDIDAFAAYLADRTAPGGGIELDVKTLKDGEATRQAVLDGFRDHLGKAAEGDVALFYYSGHGSQERAPEEFWAIEPDHLDETLVLFDSRSAGGWDLADKELARLIKEVAATGAHVLVVLDCCHSGSGTRDATEVVRRAPTDLRLRPIESFILSPEEAGAIAANSRAASAEGGIRRYAAPQSRYVLFAACRDDQEAKEYLGDGRRRGAFSYFLCDALKGATGLPTYRDLFGRISALVSSQLRDQVPQLEVSADEDLDAVFLEGAIRPSPTSYTASFREGGWAIDGGAAGGLPASTAGDAARLALFRFDAPASELADPSRALAFARVRAVGAASSAIAIEEGARLDPGRTYKAVIVSLPIPPMIVGLEGDAAACKLAREAIAAASPEGKASLYIREASGAEPPELRLRALDGRFVIARPDDPRPLVAPAEGPDAARIAVARLEHIARWTQTSRLANPASTIKPDDVKITILVGGKPVEGREIRLEYTTEGGRQVAPTFKLSLTNRSDRTLYCGLVDLTQLYKVSAGLFPAGRVKLEPNQTAWAYEDREIPATVPDAVWNEGVVEFKDLLKLIVSTQDFDPRLLNQGALDAPRSAAEPAKGVGELGSLSRHFRRVQTRDIGEEGPTTLDDWRTWDASFTTVRPLATTAIPEPGRVATLTGGLQLHGHASLRAHARLTSASLGNRALVGVSLPRILIDDPSVSVPLAFTASRGDGPGLSVLELTGVADRSAVTPEAPLRLTAPIALRANEHVLPFAHDGEFFLPLGRVAGRSSTATEIVIERLPGAPDEVGSPAINTRSLTGAIKIYFQKVIGDALDLTTAYPILGTAAVGDDGSVRAGGDPAVVRKEVAAARRIVVFVHGIIGDTRSMVPSVRLARLADGRPLASLYDVVLTYDYECLNTKIEANGRALAERLASVGLGPGHGKVVDIVAHSMGGLVSRWFIEKEGGHRVVRRLIMLGTPNGGSPWPRVFDWATMAIAAGLNSLTAMAWPATVLGGLAALAEDPTVALNQMRPPSEVLAALASSSDPGIPYAMIAGNTSLIPAAVVSPGPGRASLLGRLVSRLFSAEFLHEIADPFFLGETNDVAVSTSSMEAIRGERKPAYEIRPVACDHLSYFRDPAALKELVELLQSP